MATGYQGISEKYLGSAGGAANSILGLANTQKSIASRAPSEYAGMAAVDSNKSYDEALGIQNRNLSRMGINPNSGRFAGLQQKWALARAAAEAGARTRGRLNAENLQFSRLGQTAGTFGNAVSGLRGVASDYGDLASGVGQLMGLSGGSRNIKVRSTGVNKQLGGDWDQLVANTKNTANSGRGITADATWSGAAVTPATAQDSDLTGGSDVWDESQSGLGRANADESTFSDFDSSMDANVYSGFASDELDELFSGGDE